GLDAELGRQFHGADTASLVEGEAIGVRHALEDARGRGAVGPAYQRLVGEDARVCQIDDRLVGHADVKAEGLGASLAGERRLRIFHILCVLSGWASPTLTFKPLPTGLVCVPT